MKQENIEGEVEIIGDKYVDIGGAADVWKAKWTRKGSQEKIIVRNKTAAVVKPRRF